MQVLERQLEESSGGEIHHDLRAEVHYLLSKFYGGRKGRRVERERVLRHCREGLLLMEGREASFASMSAELHLLYARMLLRGREAGMTSKIVRHVNQAKIVSLMEGELILGFEGAVLVGDAYAGCEEEPLCDNLVRAYEAYDEAMRMVSMGKLETGREWIRVGGMQIEVMLRYLRHKRLVREGSGGVCRSNEFVICQRNGEEVREFVWSVVVKKAEGLRGRALEWLKGGEEIEEEDWRRKVESELHECVGRAYLEKGREEGKVEDLRKGASALEKAVACCGWEEDFMGRRYTMLKELTEEVERRVEIMSIGRTRENSDEDVPAAEEEQTSVDE